MCYLTPAAGLGEKPEEYTRETYSDPCNVTEKASVNRDCEDAHVDLHVHHAGVVCFVWR